MDNFALIKDGIVSNIIFAESADIIFMLLPDAEEIVLVNEQTGSAWIGGDLYNDRFRPARPFESWQWDDESWEWRAPVEQPDGENYNWDESAQEWVDSGTAE